VLNIGLSRPIHSPDYPTPDVDCALLAVHAENAGFESMFYGEHPIRPLDDPGYSVHTHGVPLYQDTLVNLARATAMTKKIKVGGGVWLMPEHNPVAFAKQLATLDHYSGGNRLLVGLGTGWSYVEITLLGGRFERRWAQMREAVTIMKMLWTQERVEYEGEFFKVPPVLCFPFPATKPHPPILLGGFRDELFPRMVDYADGWLAAFVTPEGLAAGPDTLRQRRADVDRLAAEKGRDPKSIEFSAIIDGQIDRDVIRRYEDTGLLARLNITLPGLNTVDEGYAAIDRIAKVAGL
jgi:probable F420-dependent oxidoreductase